MAGCQLLDLHAPLGTGHHDRALSDAINGYSYEELLRNRNPLLHQYFVDLLALRPCLRRDKGHAKHLFGYVLHGVRRVCNANPSPFSAAAGMDLGLEHPLIPPALLGNSPGFFGISDHRTLGHGDREFR